VFRVHKWETFPKLGDGLELLPCPRPLILGMPPTPGGGGGGGGGAHYLAQDSSNNLKIYYMTLKLSSIRVQIHML